MACSLPLPAPKTWLMIPVLPDCGTQHAYTLCNLAGRDSLFACLLRVCPPCGQDPGWEWHRVCAPGSFTEFSWICCMGLGVGCTSFHEIKEWQYGETWRQNIFFTESGIKEKDNHEIKEKLSLFAGVTADQVWFISRRGRTGRKQEEMWLRQWLDEGSGGGGRRGLRVLWKS